MDLVALFDSIEKPIAGAGDIVRFAAEPIPGFERYHVARDADGDPACLISGTVAASQERPAPIVLEHLTVQTNLECSIQRSDGQSRRDRCVVVRCRDADRRLQEYFLRSVSSAMLAVGPEPTSRDIQDAIGTLVELFRVVTLAPRKSIQGLWAELFVMWQGRDPVALARSWHVVPEERFDFCAGAQRIEVKSTSQQRRIHDFALEQIRPAAKVRVVVASVLVDSSAGGMSLRELSDGVRSKLAGDLALTLRFDRVLGTSVGSSWRHASESRFDTETAEDSLIFLEAGSVPWVSLPLPAEVTDVRFRCDVSHITPIVPSTLAAEGGILQAVVGDRRVGSRRGR